MIQKKIPSDMKPLTASLNEIPCTTYNNQCLNQTRTPLPREYRIESSTALVYRYTHRDGKGIIVYETKADNRKLQ